MEDLVSEIYELLEKSPQLAEKRAEDLLIKAESQEIKDSINWARAYALVNLNRFEEAKQIWSDIFKRTNNYRALHQVGFVQRSSGQIESALKTYLAERVLIPKEDSVAIGANLYELTYCTHLLGNISEAFQLFREYEKLEFEQPDLIERGCFFRLKGDIFLENDRNTSREAYLKSLKFFQEAEDEIASSEIQERLSKL